MMKKILSIICFCWYITTFSLAQIQAPNLICLRADTLIWELPVNNCGPFISYEIYASTNFDSGYTLLASINNPLRDFYFHPNPSGQLWYYYMQSNYNCPGEIRLSSDTLDNRPPEVSPIRSASVTGGQVELNWYPSPSPEVFAYIIYRQTSLGAIPVDTVFSGTTFTDMNATPEENSESYFVNALDRCGNTSIFDVRHTTIFLQGTSSACERNISLNWNRYEAWTGGIDRQEIWVGENGSAPILFATLDANATSFDFPVENDGFEYCLQIRSFEGGTGISSFSNELCITAEIVQPADDSYIQSVTVLPDQSIEITWGWDITAEINRVDVLRSVDNSSYDVIHTENIQPPLPGTKTYIDQDADPAEGSYYYLIQTLDDCGDVELSTYGASLFLSVNPVPDYTNQLAWTAIDIENATSEVYNVYREINGQTSLIATVEGSVQLYEDMLDATNPLAAESCYYVVGQGTLTTPGVGQLPIQLRSNLVCPEQEVSILAPNAFAPEGINQEFRPLLTFADAADYEMQIFDRYGQKIFTSRAVEDGWNGKHDGKKLPQGVYVYYIRVTQESGRVAEKKGTVLLIR